MSTLNISLPEAMKKYVDQRVAGGSYGTVSEYIRELIRRDQQHAAELDLEKKLLEGLESPDMGPWTKGDFDAIRADLRKRFGKKTR